MSLEVHDFELAAIPCYKNAARLDPADFRWPFFLAIVLSNMGSSDALEWYEDCQQFNPQYAPLDVLHGQALLSDGKEDAAAKHFEHALQIDPANSHAAVGLAQIYLDRGDLDRSRAYLQKAVIANPGHAEAYGLLAEISRQQGDLAAAGRFREAVQSLPGPTPFSNPVYWEVIKEGVSAAWYQERGRVYSRQGDYIRAEQEFRAALRLRPNEADLNDLGNVLQYLGKYDQAVVQYRAALAISPENAEGFLNLASAYAAMGASEQARNFARRAERLASASQRKDLLDRIKMLLNSLE